MKEGTLLKKEFNNKAFRLMEKETSIKNKIKFEINLKRVFIVHPSTFKLSVKAMQKLNTVF